jgi:hypothetical protein
VSLPQKGVVGEIDRIALPEAKGGTESIGASMSTTW